MRSQAAGSPDGVLRLRAFRPPAPVDNTEADLGALLGLPYSCEMPPGVCPEGQRQVKGGEGPKSSPAPHLLAGGLLRGRRLSPPTCQETEDATNRWGSCWPGPAQEEIGDDDDQDGDKGDDDTCRVDTGLLRPPCYDPRHTIAPLILPLLESLDGYSFQAPGSPENNPQPLARHRFPYRCSVPASRLDCLRLHRDTGRGTGMLGAAPGDITVQGSRHSFIQ